MKKREVKVEADNDFRHVDGDVPMCMRNKDEETDRTEKAQAAEAMK